MEDKNLTATEVQKRMGEYLARDDTPLAKVANMIMEARYKPILDRLLKIVEKHKR